MTHKSTLYLQKIERENRHKRREELREQVVMLQRRMTTRVKEYEENPPYSFHDRHEYGVDEEVSPMEEYLWIEQCESLQNDISQNIRLQSPINSNQSA